MGLGSSIGKVAKKAFGVTLPGVVANYQKRENEKQNKANQAAIDAANAYDMYTWDLANQYNDPKQQMARLKAAGLNPNLVYGSGSVTGNTTSTAGSNGVASVSTDYVTPTMNKASQALGLAQGYASLRNTNTQNDLLNYQMGQTMAQTAKIKAETQDLNNYLNGTGKTTYDRPTQLEKLVEAVFGLKTRDTKGQRKVLGESLAEAIEAKTGIFGRIGDEAFNIFGSNKYDRDIDDRSFVKY